jgi:hypothetical protein
LLIINELHKGSENFLAKNAKNIWWNEKVVVPLPRICLKGQIIMDINSYRYD